MSKKSNFYTSRGWKILFRYLFQYKKEVIFLSFLGIISAFANASVPYLVGKFFDALINPGSTFEIFGFTVSSWAGIIIIWLIVQAVANVMDLINDKKNAEISVMIEAEYPVNAISHLLSLPVSFHKKHKHGDVFDRVLRASHALSAIIGRIVIYLAPQMLSVFIGFAFAYSINSILASVLVLGVFVYIATLVKIVPPIVKLQKKAMRAWNEAYGESYDAVANYQTIKQATAEKYETKKLRSKFVGKAFRLWYRVEGIWTNINFFQRIVIVLTQLSIFTLSVFFVGNGSLSIGGLIALNGYAMIIFGPFVTIARNWQIIQNGVIAIERAEDVLNLPTENADRKTRSKIENIQGNVEFKNVFFSYKKGAETVLKNINLKVKKGEVVALVGKSGVGKSTTVELISGYYYPTKGSVIIDGKSTKSLDLESLREKIAVVPQEAVLFNDTIEKNIKYGRPGASHEEVIRAAKQAHADVFIDKFAKKYKQVVGERGIKLSVGEKQRVAIARAILRDPKILILDEPTSALDVVAEKFIRESLDKLMENRTTFIIAHRLSTVRRADRIYVFEKGHIVEEGRHEDLIKINNGVYKELYNLHIGLK